MSCFFALQLFVFDIGCHISLQSRVFFDIGTFFAHQTHFFTSKCNISHIELNFSLQSAIFRTSNSIFHFEVQYFQTSEPNSLFSVLRIGRECAFGCTDAYHNNKLFHLLFSDCATVCAFKKYYFNFQPFQCTICFFFEKLKNV